MLECKPTHSLIGKLLQRSSLALCKFSTGIAIVEHCEQGYGCVCETLLPDVVAPEAHQNDHSYVCELSGPTFDSLCKNLAWWAVTWRTSQNSKLEGGHLCRDGRSPV